MTGRPMSQYCLGASYRTMVESSASPGESYYRDGTAWLDLIRL